MSVNYFSVPIYIKNFDVKESLVLAKVCVSFMWRL